MYLLAPDTMATKFIPLSQCVAAIVPRSPKRHWIPFCSSGWKTKKFSSVEPNEGTVYVTSGGSGGGLEEFQRTRTPFMANGKRSHHFLYFAVNGHTLQMRSYDLEGRLFDTMDMHKPAVLATTPVASGAEDRK